jgi:signal transduction histidine kinase
MSSSANPRAPWTTILSIDDQPATLNLLVDCLTQYGHHVIAASSGEEGLEKATLVRPDLILLDLNMPGIDGFETCRRLRDNEATRDIPLIFMTFSDSREDRLKGFEAGAVDYIAKPLDAMEVLARIRAHVALSDLRRTLAEQNATLREEVLAREQAQEELRRSNVELQQLAIERAIRVQAEGESAGLRRLLEERDEMLADRDEMLNLLAHEVRQPLNNASAALENAASAISAASDAAVATKPLVRAQHVLNHVIGTLNNALAAATLLSKGSAGATAETDLDMLLDLVLPDIASDQRDRVVVERHDSVRTVHLQPVLMRLALCNLLTNALAYSPATSVVTLKVFDVEKPLAIAFEVADQGEGIPPSLLPRIFNKGTRGSNARWIAGSGLGLHIVRRVVDLHGGRVELLPNSPHGTIARITIPQGVDA